MRDEEIKQMRRLLLFSTVDRSRNDSKLLAAFLQRFPVHIELAREGDLADSLHVVVEDPAFSRALAVELALAYRGVV
jgi:CRP/FNR family transcriptional regulator, transcriptional activator FtrB